MPERTVICNTYPLLYLHQVNQLDLPPKLYSELLVPPAVRKELLVGGERGVDVPDISKKSWIKVQLLADSMLLAAVIDLGPGENEGMTVSTHSLGGVKQNPGFIYKIS